MLDLNALSDAVVRELSFGQGYKLNRSEHWFICHGEKTASAHYNDKKQVFKCFGCGAAGGVTDLAKRLGIGLDAFDDDAEPAGAVYEYQSKAGRVVMRKHRKYGRDPETKKWKKTFVIESLVDGQWQPGQAAEKLLYKLPDVLGAIKNGKAVWIANGEKAVDALIDRYGVVATCGPHGENFLDWEKWKFFDYFKGAGKIVIIRDFDAHGKEFAKDLSHELHTRAREVMVAHSATKKPAHDAFDHIKAGHALGDFAVEYTLTRGLQGLIGFNGAFSAVEIDFLWDPYFPKGKCVLLDADGGTGKSAWCLALAAGLSRGLLPGMREAEAIAPAKTLYLIGDPDGADEYETVYRANGGLPGRIMYLPHVFPLNADGLKRLEESIVMGEFNLVVIDALYYYLEGVVKDANTALDVVAVCRRLGEIAKRTGCTIVGIRHTTKGVPGRKASELGMGSVAFRNTFRGQLVMRWHPDEKGMVVVSDTKGSILVERGEDFAFRRVGRYGAIEYINDFVSPFESENRKQTGRPNEARKSAAEALREYMANGDETHFEIVIAHIRKVTGASESTVRRAAAAIGVAMRDGLWSLDPFAEEAGKEVQQPLYE